jgi:hypothetical protein
MVQEMTQLGDIIVDIEEKRGREREREIDR